MSGATISTHVLDVSQGKPVPDVRVTLVGEGDTPVGVGRTGPDGRIARLTDEAIQPGSYGLIFELDECFLDRPHLFEMVAFDLVIDEARHYHIPLLLSPFGLSSYRGS